MAPYVGRSLAARHSVVSPHQIQRLGTTTIMATSTIDSRDVRRHVTSVVTSHVTSDVIARPLMRSWTWSDACQTLFAAPRVFSFLRYLLSRMPVPKTRKRCIANSAPASSCRKNSSSLGARSPLATTGSNQHRGHAAGLLGRTRHYDDNTAVELHCGSIASPYANCMKG